MEGIKTDSPGMRDNEHNIELPEGMVFQVGLLNRGDWEFLYCVGRIIKLMDYDCFFVGWMIDEIEIEGSIDEDKFIPDCIV